MAINTSRLRVLRSLTGDSANGPYRTISDDDEDDTGGRPDADSDDSLMGGALKDRLAAAGTAPPTDMTQYPDQADVGREIQEKLGETVSQPGPNPMVLTPEYLEAVGYSTTINGTEEQRLIDKMVLSGQMDPGEGMERKSGTWSQVAADAAGNVNSLLYSNAQLRKTEVAATDFWDNFVDTLLPQFGADLITGNDYQIYQQALQGFTNTLAASSQSPGRPGTTEAAAALKQGQFGVGVNDSPEEIAAAQGARDHALQSLFPSLSPYYKPGAVKEGMKMIDRMGTSPEALAMVSSYLESEGIYGQYFDQFWPKTGKYAQVRQPSGFTGTMEEQGYSAQPPNEYGKIPYVKVLR